MILLWSISLRITSLFRVGLWLSHCRVTACSVIPQDYILFAVICHIIGSLFYCINLWAVDALMWNCFISCFNSELFWDYPTIIFCTLEYLGLDYLGLDYPALDYFFSGLSRSESYSQLSRSSSSPTPYIGGRRSPAVACWASDHWVASSNPLRGKFRH